MKTLSIWGSTGIIGTKAINVALKYGFKITALIANKNHSKLIEQAKAIHPKNLGVADHKTFEIVKEALSSTDIEVLPATEFENLAQLEVDCCVMAISGNAGVKPTFECLGHAKRLAIATKEAIISGGKLLRNLSLQKSTEIIPIDSEHNSIFQCLLSENPADVKELILTASGGPFVDLDEKDLKDVTVEKALQHPNWNMGKKNTIDSATLINKALEIIEAAYLFDIDISKVKPLIHTNSIIHGMVKLNDASIKALLSSPDMALPISYALNYPNRINCDLPDLDFESIGSLNFKKPKDWQMRNINLAYQAFNENKVIAFNIANEIAISKFLNRELNFCEIYGFIQNILENAPAEKINSARDIEDIIAGIARFVKMTR